MSSIAYLADEKMLAYHRSKGSRNINFWRVGIRNFENFEPGDFLFFIDGNKRHPLSREKGIVGYGVFKQLREMSVKRTWQQYKNENGYETYDKFENAVLEMSKSESLPDKIQSIELSNVIYFNQAIYLGEFTNPININLESFLYLESSVTRELLSRASMLGIDTWFKLFNENLTNDNILDDIEISKLRSTLADINIEWTQEQSRLINQYSAFSKVGNIAYLVKDENVEIFIPVSSAKNQFYVILGIVYKIKTEIKKDTQFTLVVKENARPYEEEFKNLGLKLLYT